METDELSVGDDGRLRRMVAGVLAGWHESASVLESPDVDRLLDLALAAGVVRAWTAVIAPALRDLGSQYSAAGRYIAAEHLLSGATSTALARVPRPAMRPRILLGCAPAELHSLPLEAPAAALATADYDQIAEAAGTSPRPATVAACGPGWDPGALPAGVMLLISFQPALAVVTRLPNPTGEHLPEGLLRFPGGSRASDADPGVPGCLPSARADRPVPGLIRVGAGGEHRCATSST